MSNVKLGHAPTTQVRAADEGVDLGHIDLQNVDLSGADLAGARLYGANLAGADLNGADLTGANLCSANLAGADLRGADLRRVEIHRANLRGTKGLPQLSSDPVALRAAVADQIATHPELLDQDNYGDGDPECDTPCCVAGWACRLGGGTHGYCVPTAATLLLHVDGLPMPSFVSDSTEAVLFALRATASKNQKRDK